MAYIATTDGRHVSIEDVQTFGLAGAQKAVGGYIEPFKCPDGRWLLVNEDGLRLKLPVNHHASILAHGVIVGDVVVFLNDEELRLWDGPPDVDEEDPLA